MYKKQDISWLIRKTNELRILILDMVMRAGAGHIGGAFSIIEVMVALYFRVMNHKPSDPSWEKRDRLIFSKGHGCLALYIVLAESGYFDKKFLKSFCKDGGQLAGHPEREFIPGVEITSGSLGHGLSIGIGMALAAKIDRKKYHIYVVLSDGECNEGSTWEAFMSGSQFYLDNLTVIIDSNKYISLGPIADILNIEPLGDRLRNFGWAVNEINGHDMNEIVRVFKKVPFKKGKPSVIIANTVKGKGVSFMENVPKWHYCAPNKEEAESALQELKESLNK